MQNHDLLWIYENEVYQVSKRGISVEIVDAVRDVRNQSLVKAPNTDQETLAQDLHPASHQLTPTGSDEEDEESDDDADNSDDEGADDEEGEIELVEEPRHRRQRLT